MTLRIFLYSNWSISVSWGIASRHELLDAPPGGGEAPRRRRYEAEHCVFAGAGKNGGRVWWRRKASRATRAYGGRKLVAGVFKKSSGNWPSDRRPVISISRAQRRGHGLCIPRVLFVSIFRWIASSRVGVRREFINRAPQAFSFKRARV